MRREYQEMERRVDEIKINYKCKIAEVIHDENLSEREKKLEIMKLVDDFAKEIKNEIYPYYDDD